MLLPATARPPHKSSVPHRTLSFFLSSLQHSLLNRSLQQSFYITLNRFYRLAVASSTTVTNMSSTFTMDKAVIEALNEKEKVRLLCYFISNTSSVTIDWADAAERFGCQKNSMAAHTPPILKKLKVDGGAKAKANGKGGTPNGKKAGGPGRKKRQASTDDSDALETPSKRSKKGAGKAQMKKEDTPNDGDLNIKYNELEYLATYGTDDEFSA
ncbi:hypothetical protein NA57DRAFT_57194 [Rhizodiscina lignyota]|uniref:Uncharacterized protein n=1 Tax=Rhizodiscina lignyota TaxID=1504668 RepID=A0A9P4IEX8_9PEZI|nr:hypothetical protein NA57DRAFT_57194 [Rhizodiscina lignyota]